MVDRDREFCFQYGSLKSISIPRSVTVLGRCCFEGAKVGTLTCESGLLLTKVDQSCFARCSLTLIRLPDHETSGTQGAFSLARFIKVQRISSPYEVEDPDECIAKADDEQVTLQDELRSVRLENEQLKRARDMLVQELETKNAELEARMTDITRAQGEQDEHFRARDALAQRVKQFEGHICRLNAERKQSDERDAETKREIDELGRQQNRRIGQLMQEVAQRDAEIARLESEQAQGRKIDGHKDKEIQEQREQMTKLEGEIERLRNECIEHHRVRQEQREQLRQIATREGEKNDEIQELSAQLAAAKQKVADYSRTIGAQAELLTDLERTIEERDITIKHLTTERDQCHITIHEKDGEIEELSKHCKASEEQEQQVEELTKQVDERDIMIERLNVASGHREIEMQALSAQLAETKGEIDRLYGERDSHLEEIDTQTGRVGRLIEAIGRLTRRAIRPTRARTGDDRNACVFDLSGFAKGRKLGQGTFGCVHAYDNTETGEQVCVKTPHEMDDEAFWREVGLLIKLNHPCIMEIKGVHESRHRNRLVTEYVRNGTLQDFMKNDRLKSLSHTKRMKVIAGIVLGMQFMHKQGIVHRDLKPGNILIDDRYEVKICDFGESKQMQPGAEETLGKGTPLYQAPEMHLCDADPGKVNPMACDVFSFGLILYEMVYGTRGHDGWSRSDVWRFYGTGKRPEFKTDSDCNPDVEQRVRQLIQQCWDQEPSRRPSFNAIFAGLQEMDFKLFKDVRVIAVKTFVESVLLFETAQEAS